MRKVTRIFMGVLKSVEDMRVVLFLKAMRFSLPSPFWSIRPVTEPVYRASLAFVRFSRFYILEYPQRRESMSTEASTALSNVEGSIPPKYALNTLLPVIWQLIARHLGGYDIMALLMTCSRGVVGRWRQITIRDFEIVPSSSPRWSGSSIGSLQYLRGLQSITLQDNGMKAWNQGPAMLIYFPPQLRKLELFLPMRLDAWLTILPVKDSKNEVLSSESVSSRLQHIGVESKKFTQVDLGSLFPVLHSLEIGQTPFDFYRPKPATKGKSKGVSPEIQAERAGIAAITYLYQHLPSTLKKLLVPSLLIRPQDWENAIKHSKVQTPSSSSPSSSSSSISPNNSYLHSSILGVLDSLPSSLETLHLDLYFMSSINGPHVAAMPGHLLSKLPKSLTCLSCIFSRMSWPGDASAFLEPLSSMTSLNSLEINTDCSPALDARLFSSFPAHHGLASLKIWLGASKPIISDDFFSSLPQSLESLELLLRDPQFPRTPLSKSIGSQMPKSLKSLVIRLSRSFGAPIPPIGGIQDLPSGLTELDWRERCIISDDQVAALPKTLESLRLHFSSLAFSTPMPPNHRIQNHYEGPMEQIGEDRRIGTSRTAFPDEVLLEKSLSNACALYFPPVLRKLVIVKSSFGNSFFLDLPTSIKHLEAETDQALAGDIFANCALEYLKIDAPYLSLDCLRSLPTTLTTFHLTEPSGSALFNRQNIATPKQGLEHHYTMNDQHIGMLPASLTELRVIGARNITDDAQWPPHLTQLVLTASCFLSDKSLTRLPRCLRVLQVQRIVIAPHLCGPKAAIIGSMPPFLLAHALPWMTLKNRHVDFSSLP